VVTDGPQYQRYKTLTQIVIIHMHDLKIVIPRSEKEGTKPPYVCPGCSNHTYSNNMITRFHVQ
jgi:hypothetical protein